MIALDPPEIDAPAPQRRSQRLSRQDTALVYRWYLLAAQAAAEGRLGHAADAPRRRPGRPSKLRHETVGYFLASVRLGNDRETAARAAGINPATMYRWLRNPGPEYRTFRDLLDLAEAEVKAEVVGNLYRMTATSPQAAMYWLSRHYPDEFGPLPPSRARRPRGVPACHRRAG